jgi:hypothetical protein
MENAPARGERVITLRCVALRGAAGRRAAAKRKAEAWRTTECIEKLATAGQITRKMLMKRWNFFSAARPNIQSNYAAPVKG